MTSSTVRKSLVLTLTTLLFTLVAALTPNATFGAPTSAPDKVAVRMHVNLSYDDYHGNYFMSVQVRNTDANRPAKDVVVRVKIPQGVEYWGTTNYDCLVEESVGKWVLRVEKTLEGNFVVCNTMRINAGEKRVYPLNFSRHEKPWGFRQKVQVSGKNFDPMVRRPRIYPY